MTTSVSISVFCLVLIQQLGSPVYHHRARATRTLNHLLPHSLPYLERAERAEDPEVALRAKILVHRYYTATSADKASKVLPTNYPYLPWIDQLPHDQPHRVRIVTFYLHQARDKIGHKGPPHWEDHRLATQYYLEELYSQRVTAEQVPPLLDRMRDREIEWIRKNGQRYSPPVRLPGDGR